MNKSKIDNRKETRPWNKPAQDLLSEFDADKEKGLTENEAERRLNKYGKNILSVKEETSVLKILFNQIKSLIVIILLAASLASFFFNEPLQGIAIAIALLINIVIGFFTELKAVRSMEALKSLGRVEAKVRREGDEYIIAAEDLVPGDIVLVEEGSIIAADMRTIEATELEVDESTLTGESESVEKINEKIDGDVSIAERKNILHKGTAVVRGKATSIVVATGMDTEVGRIAELVESSVEEITPLEKRLNAFGHKLLWATLILAVIIAVSGIIAGRDIFKMIETSIALAIAAIPEGLPIVATMALARGMWRMAKRNALIERLSSVETLGATTIICTDKTGTITENEMNASKIVLDNTIISLDDENKLNKRSDLEEIIKIGVLCNNVELKENKEDKKKPKSEPMELSLLKVGKRIGIEKNELLKKMPRVKEDPFDRETKMMATYHKLNNEYYVAVKGAPEKIVESCSSVMKDSETNEFKKENKTDIIKESEKIAGEGYRLLAFAFKKVGSADSDPYKNLIYVGLIAFKDPPRKDVKDAVKKCISAGIRIIMVTGDQMNTAFHIAKSVGIMGDEDEDKKVKGAELEDVMDLNEEQKAGLRKSSLFARVSPEQKLNLISLHQESGEIVAMTGDGVNDAPALKKADIGISMGMRGTDVARQASDMILKDDAFSTIVEAVKEGRVIFDNIRKFITYLLPCHVSEIVAVALASFLGAPLPLLPLQILFLNIVTDVFPALAVGVGEGNRDVMTRPPRNPDEPIITRYYWLTIIGFGTLMGLATLASLFIGKNLMHLNENEAVTASFLTLGFTSLWHVFNVRDPGTKLIRNEITTNYLVWLALLTGITLLLAAVYLPGLNSVLHTAYPTAKTWFLIILMSLVPLLMGQIYKFFERSK